MPPPGGAARTVNYTTVDGSATVANNDYLPTSGTITFGPNSPTLQIVTVTVNGDITFEANEVFFLRLSNPVNAKYLVEADGIGTIFNDDVEPSFSINDVSANEGNAGTTAFTFTITLGNPDFVQFAVTYSTANGTAVAPGDYTAVSNGTVTFLPTETSKTVTVLVNGDTAVEPNETFFVDMTTVSNGVIGRATGTETILNDDGVIGPTRDANAGRNTDADTDTASTAAGRRRGRRQRRTAG